VQRDIVRRTDNMGKMMEKTYGDLAFYAYGTREEMGEAAAKDAAQRIRNIIKKKGSVNAVFAAAPSQNEFLASLTGQDIDWSRVQAFHMDEYIGLDKDAPQGFGNFLREAIFGKVKFANVNYLNGQTEDPAGECRRYSKLLEQNPIDIIFLGIGENGHLAFNDPAVADFNDPYLVKVVELDSICRNQQVNDGCFEKLDDVPKSALTLTMSLIMSVPEAIAVVPTGFKKEAVTKTATGEISTACPASILRKHNNAAVYLDRESALDLI
jgi:glucosamine-6-phosphate deaminase